MKYSDLKKILSDVEEQDYRRLEVAVAMMMASFTKDSDDFFDAMCDYAWAILNKLDYYNTQDICDAVYVASHEDNYVFEDDYVLTLEDLLTLNRLDDVLEYVTYCH